MAEEFLERLYVARMEREGVRRERRPKGVDVRLNSRTSGDALDEPPNHAVVALTLALQVPLGRNKVVLDHPCVDRLLE